MEEGSSCLWWHGEAAVSLCVSLQTWLPPLCLAPIGLHALLGVALGCVGCVWTGTLGTAAS
jgi:hypothetical protein